jgi:hypothetical protein
MTYLCAIIIALAVPFVCVYYWSYNISSLKNVAVLFIVSIVAGFFWSYVVIAACIVIFANIVTTFIEGFDK